MSTRKKAPVKFVLPQMTKASKKAQAARAQRMLDRLMPKEEWLNNIKQRTDVSDEYRTAEFYDRFENEIRELIV
jgi:hypothetical protein